MSMNQNDLGISYSLHIEDKCNGYSLRRDIPFIISPLTIHKIEKSDDFSRPKQLPLLET